MVVGKYGVLVMGADGSYYFKLNNASPEVQALNGADPNDPSSKPDSLTEKFRVIVRDDKGGVTYKEITVDIQGTDDMPMLYLYGVDGSLTATGPAARCLSSRKSRAALTLTIPCTARPRVMMRTRTTTMT